MKKSTKWVVLSLFILCASIVPVNDFDAQENAENSVNLHDNVQTSTSDEYSVSFETTTEESHEDVNNEITEASTSSEETKQVLAENAELSDEIGAISPLVGEGTLESPYTAETADELIRVMSEINNDSGSGTYYVALTADIVYTDADVFEFYKNVEIDGQNHHMLYTNASNSTASNTGYRVKISGLRIKLKNMNFGSATLTDENGVIYGNQSYYGILGAGSLSVLSFDAVFENVNYYGKTGAQPLLAWHTESPSPLRGKMNLSVKQEQTAKSSWKETTLHLRKIRRRLSTTKRVRISLCFMVQLLADRVIGKYESLLKKMRMCN